MSINQEITDLIKKNYSKAKVIVKNDFNCNHYKLIVIADFFEELSLLKRHQAITRLVKPYLKEAIHALHLKTYTPSEWEKTNKSI